MSGEELIDKAALREFLESARQTHHHIYALMTGLPKETFFLERKEVVDSPYRNRNREPEKYRYTVEEFFREYDDFDPSFEFELCFAAPLERIFSYEVDDYADGIRIDLLECLNMEDMEHFIIYFLYNYCQKCLYENRPFEMTSDIIASMGFTDADAEWYKSHVDRLNGLFKYEFYKEYEKFSRLDFIRNGDRGTPPAFNEEQAARKFVPKLVWSYINR